MAARGYEPLFAVPEEGWLTEELQRQNLPYRLLPARNRTDWRFGKWLIDLLQQEQIGLVHAHMMAMNLYGSVAARITHRPCLATLHGRLYDLEKPRRRLVYRFISKMASRLIAVSAELEQALIREAGIHPSRVLLVPNGVAMPELSRRTARRGVAPTIIAVGSLKEIKGHRDLIQALALLKPEFPQVQLLLAGDGPLRGELEVLAAKLDLKDAVCFPGNRSDVEQLLLGADIFALPSLSEGQSLSLMEAMAAGLPVVATAVGGNGEIAQPDQTAFLVPAKSPEKLAAALGRLLRDSELAQHFGEAGRRRAEALFSTEVMLSRYEALYRELLSPLEQTP